MAAYTATNMVGRSKGNRAFHAAHVDRTFLDGEGRKEDLTFAPHISRNRMKDNVYIRLQEGVEGKDFREYELNYYRNNYSAMLDEQNRKHDEGGHPSRKKTIESYYCSPRTCPEEQFLQIGDKDSHPSAGKFRECVEDYIGRFNARYGDFCRILDCGIHNDEATPHAHIRRVWEYGMEGRKKVGQNQALMEHGFERPDLNKEEGRFNNPKMAFTKEDRELWVEVCREHGLEIKESERNRRVPHLEKEEFIDMQIAGKERQAESLSRQVESLSRQAGELGEQAGKLERKVENLEGKLALTEGRLMTEDEVRDIEYGRLRNGDIRLSADDFNNLRRTASENLAPKGMLESAEAKLLLLEDERKKFRKEAEAERKRLEIERAGNIREMESGYKETPEGRRALGKAHAYDLMRRDGLVPERYRAEAVMEREEERSRAGRRDDGLPSR